MIQRLETLYYQCLPHIETEIVSGADRGVG